MYSTLGLRKVTLPYLPFLPEKLKNKKHTKNIQIKNTNPKQTQIEKTKKYKKNTKPKTKNKNKAKNQKHRRI